MHDDALLPPRLILAHRRHHLHRVDVADRYITNNTAFQILTYSQPLPYVEQVPPFDIASFLSVMLYPFIVSFLLPVYVNAIVMEKEHKLREMMRMVRALIARDAQAFHRSFAHGIEYGAADGLA